MFRDRAKTVSSPVQPNMPLWRIFSNAKTFSVEQRAALSRDITALYSMLPAFYVNVVFINCGDEDVWIGGEPKTNFVRIVIEQVARTMPSPDTERGRKFREGWMDRINDVCCAHTEIFGISWTDLTRRR